MYAQHGYTPKSSRSVGLTGSLLVCAGMMTVMATMLAPKILPKDPVTTLIGENVPLPEPPPPVEEKKPEPQPQPKAPELYQPSPKVPTTQPDPAPMTSTNVMPDTFKPLPDPGTGTAEGPASEPVKPPPLPYVGAKVDPKFAGAFQPDYPSQEIRLGREGNVTVRVLVGTDGRVKAVEKVSATSDAFFEATKNRALAKWRFKPATRGGTPEESWKQYSVKFVLNDG